MPACHCHSVICISQAGQSAADTRYTFAQENVPGMSTLVVVNCTVVTESATTAILIQCFNGLTLLLKNYYFVIIACVKRDIFNAI